MKYKDLTNSLKGVDLSSLGKKKEKQTLVTSFDDLKEAITQGCIMSVKMGTRTGRWSGGLPNTQSLPKSKFSSNNDNKFLMMGSDYGLNYGPILHNLKDTIGINP